MCLCQLCVESVLKNKACCRLLIFWSIVTTMASMVSVYYAIDVHTTHNVYKEISALNALLGDVVNGKSIPRSFLNSNFVSNPIFAGKGKAPMKINHRLAHLYSFTRYNKRSKYRNSKGLKNETNGLSESKLNNISMSQYQRDANYQRNTFKKDKTINSREQLKHFLSQNFPINIAKKRNWKSHEHLSLNGTMVNNTKIKKEVENYTQNFTVGKDETKKELKKKLAKLSSDKNDQSYDLEFLKSEDDLIAETEKEIEENAENKQEKVIPNEELASVYNSIEDKDMAGKNLDLQTDLKAINVTDPPNDGPSANNNIDSNENMDTNMDNAEREINEIDENVNSVETTEGQTHVDIEEKQNGNMDTKENIVEI